jgi:GntR family transcriptional regulator
MTSPDLFSVATGSAEPIYRQLTQQVRRLVASGQLCAGDDLPSVRELAQALAVNPMTVSRAYSQLEADGVLQRRRGLGMVVAAPHERAQRVADRGELLRPTLERAALEAQQLELTEAQALALFQKALRDVLGAKR